MKRRDVSFIFYISLYFDSYIIILKTHYKKIEKSVLHKKMMVKNI